MHLSYNKSEAISQWINIILDDWKFSEIAYKSFSSVHKIHLPQTGRAKIGFYC